MIRLAVSPLYQGWVTRCFTLWVTVSGGFMPGSGVFRRRCAPEPRKEQRFSRRRVKASRQFDLLVSGTDGRGVAKQGKRLEPLFCLCGRFSVCGIKNVSAIAA